MKRSADPWVLVLAAGSGTRLGALTVDPQGHVVPKQFCSLRGGRSLLLDTIDRALHLTPRERVVVVVAADHERWWRPQLACLLRENVVVQPRNRGTTAGILLPLAHILGRDPAASVAVLPSDHHVDQPEILNDAMRTALLCAAADPAKLVLLGIAPDQADAEYGWIQPGPRRGALQEVEAFVEKPPLATARELQLAGAVWNSFLFAADAQSLWRLAAKHAPATAAALATAVLGPEVGHGRSLEAVYAELPSVDFSAVVLGGSPGELRLLHVPACGWTDLGTPARVVECLQRLDRGRAAPQRAQWFPTVDLARVVSRRPRATVGA